MESSNPLSTTNICNTGEVTGCEALIRWNHPERGLLYPGSFISIAEKNGLINDIGWWVLREACRQNKSGRIKV
jgi:EAL domain-containing protein (putative c-di-GMP-specific phosphodiesterase class I)